MMFILMCLFILGYWIFEATTEWMVWQSIYREIPICVGDYHRYRVFEALAIFGMGSFGSWIKSPTIWHQMGIFGMWIIGWTIYEAILTQRSGDGIWVKTTPWSVRIFGRNFEAKLPRWAYVTFFLSGLVILEGAIYFI